MAERHLGERRVKTICMVHMHRVILYPKPSFMMCKVIPVIMPESAQGAVIALLKQVVLKVAWLAIGQKKAFAAQGGMFRRN